MDFYLRVVGVSVIGAVLAVFIRKTSPDMGLLAALAVCGVILSVLLIPLRDVTVLLREMMEWSGLSEDVYSPLLKTLGITLICRVGGDLCRDAGQSAMATHVEIGGALGTVLVSLPLLRAVWQMLDSLI